MSLKSQVLIIDDDQDMSALLVDWLGDRFDCACAHSAAEGLRVTSSREFDIIISDVVLNDMSGTEVLERIRREGSQVPFILMTGTPCLETSMAAMRLKATAYLQKPFKPEEIRNLVYNTLRAQRETRELMKDETVRASLLYARQRLQLIEEMDHQWVQFQRLAQLLARATESAKEAPRDLLASCVSDYLLKALKELGGSLEKMKKIDQQLTLIQPDSPNPAWQESGELLSQAAETVFEAAQVLNGAVQRSSHPNTNPSSNGAGSKPGSKSAA